MRGRCCRYRTILKRSKPNCRGTGYSVSINFPLAIRSELRIIPVAMRCKMRMSVGSAISLLAVEVGFDVDERAMLVYPPQLCAHLLSVRQLLLIQFC